MKRRAMLALLSMAVFTIPIYGRSRREMTQFEKLVLKALAQIINLQREQIFGNWSYAMSSINGDRTTHMNAYNSAWNEANAADTLLKHLRKESR